MIPIAPLFGAAFSAPQTQQRSPQNPKLVHAAHEFEASMMKELLQPLQRDPLFSENGEDSGLNDVGGSADALMSFGSEAMAQAISDQGGFGIATSILKHFHDRAAKPPVKIVP